MVILNKDSNKVINKKDVDNHTVSVAVSKSVKVDDNDVATLKEETKYYKSKTKVNLLRMFYWNKLYCSRYHEGNSPNSFWCKMHSYLYR